MRGSQVGLSRLSVSNYRHSLDESSLAVTAACPYSLGPALVKVVLAHYGTAVGAAALDLVVIADSFAIF